MTRASSSSCTPAISVPMCLEGLLTVVVFVRSDSLSDSGRLSATSDARDSNSSLFSFAGLSEVAGHPCIVIANLRLIFQILAIILENRPGNCRPYSSEEWNECAMFSFWCSLSWITGTNVVDVAYWRVVEWKKSTSWSERLTNLSLRQLSPSMIGGHWISLFRGAIRVWQ